MSQGESVLVVEQPAEPVLVVESAQEAEVTVHVRDQPEQVAKDNKGGASLLLNGAA